MSLPAQFRLTGHARRRMAERDISEGQISEALQNPTKIGRDTRQRTLIKKVYERKGKKRLLLLAMEWESDRFCIVTVIDTTKVKKYL